MGHLPCVWQVELWDKFNALFAVINRCNNVYLVMLAIILLDSVSCCMDAWMCEGVNQDEAHEDIIKQIDLVAIVGGGHGSDVSLLTWHCRLGHPSFCIVVEPSKGG